MRFEQNYRGYLHANGDGQGLIVEPNGDGFLVQTYANRSTPTCRVTRDEMVELTRRLVQQFPEALDD